MGAAHCVEIAKLSKTYLSKLSRKLLNTLALTADEQGVSSLSCQYLARRLDSSGYDVMDAVKELNCRGLIRTVGVDHHLTLSVLRPVPHFVKLTALLCDYVYDGLQGDWWVIPRSPLDSEERQIAVSLRWRHLALINKNRDYAGLIIDNNLRSHTLKQLKQLEKMRK